MNDDWSERTGERELWTINTPANDVGAPLDADPVGVLVALDGVSERDARIVDTYFQEAARDASEDTSPATAEEQANIDAIAAFTEQLMATPPATAARARRRPRPES